MHLRDGRLLLLDYTITLIGALYVATIKDGIAKRHVFGAIFYRSWGGASGCHMVLFTTGRGTLLGGPGPVVKISSNTQLAERKKKWIGFNAGELVDGADLNVLSEQLMEQILDLASGTLTKNEQMGCRDFTIWKSGVTL